MSKRPNLTKLRELREKQDINQVNFWAAYGVTQSAGSRYESDQENRSMAQPVAMLIWLHQTGRLTDQELATARDATKGFVRSKPNARGAR